MYKYIIILNSLHSSTLQIDKNLVFGRKSTQSIYIILYLKYSPSHVSLYPKGETKLFFPHYYKS